MRDSEFNGSSAGGYVGLLLAVSVTVANVQDRGGGHLALASGMSKYPGIQTLYVDSEDAGQCAQVISQLHDIRVQVVSHSANKNAGRWVHADQP